MKTLVLIPFIMLGTCASAQELVYGLGGVRYSSDPSQSDTQVSLEYRTAPFHQRRFTNFRWGGAVVGHTRGDLWAGLGIVVQKELDENWFVEGSFMPGIYHGSSQETKLGNAIEFRSLLAVGYKVSDKTSISLAIDHRSNGGLSDHNPGVNGLSLRLHRKY
ncbi:acyloxyacyl hydrolase [Neptunicoccus cionae]|uniref:Acyloxyacyl hydrolase n=1 Tax=Neptunicoccus cionae TaxID=2035344 RepID=A0A916VS44_9RHOB|nr:acyloxyacyl hydrolase [Amylibacter cionae]GGA28711.1 hypothetical protein GCM10011498_32310 [Amylibacter cionae]